MGEHQMKLAWLTDVHLNFVEDEYRHASLVETIESHRADAVLIGGDIAEAPDFSEYLERLAAGISAPIYFVLGNHDYYKGSVANVRQLASSLTRGSDQLGWLPERKVVTLSEQTSLVGHGGWGDARVGDFLQSEVVLNDYFLIEDLHRMHDYPENGPVLTERLMGKLHELGDEAAGHFRAVLAQAMQASRHVIVLTHVPPFLEACWHEGELSDLNWVPHFVCEAVGAELKAVMKEHPDHRMTVLCGHTHSSGHARILDNLEVFTGGATYGDPQIEQVLEVP